MIRSTLPLAALVLLLAGCNGISGGETSGNISAPVVRPAPTPTPTPTATATPVGLALTGDTMPVHDPAIIKDGNTYYLFATGAVGDREGLLATRTSTDLTAWTWRGAAYTALPAWATTAVPGTTGIWAPDIVKRGGEYRLYYSVSTFGKNQSAIGLTTNNALNLNAPAAGWTDKGAVIQSQTTDNFNAIDPAVFTDADGREWMAFGSFWTGIKMVRLDPATGLRLASDRTIYPLATRPAPGAIEAPFVIRRGDYYYLFASFDECCKGADSTYNTVVGRSKTVTGPYLDKAGTSMLDGGGTTVLASGRGTGARYVGRGHVAVLQEATGDHIVYHAYDTQRNGAPTLQIQKLNWDADGWPVAQ
ncbi:arabinan endo-1,5-alpha-L-arabinosidase [Sphingomonas sp. VNH70]|uniref:arabinan endo-1,5-alpha-L-arabinosidase n=1 Tax=Sphingomonas silueang TaxID=3156617 RepID=UPI0032B393BD